MPVLSHLSTYNLKYLRNGRFYSLDFIQVSQDEIVTVMRNLNHIHQIRGRMTQFDMSILEGKKTL
jgi:hypothetical protein